MENHWDELVGELLKIPGRPSVLFKIAGEALLHRLVDLKVPFPVIHEELEQFYEAWTVAYTRATLGKLAALETQTELPPRILH